MSDTDILTAEQKKALMDALKQITLIKAQIELAKKAGIDVSAQEKQLAELEKQVQLLHNVYVAPTTRSPR